MAGQSVGVQRLRTVLTRRDQLVQEITGVLIVTTAQVLHTGDPHPETCHLLLQGHIHLRARERERRDNRVLGSCGQVLQPQVKEKIQFRVV